MTPLMTIGLPSDEIIIWIGFLPTDKHWIRKRLASHLRDGRCRVVVSLPLHYPELLVTGSDDYLNRHLLAIIHDSLEHCGFVVTQHIDPAAVPSMFARVMRGGLDAGEMYLISRADSLSMCGEINCWGDLSQSRIVEYCDRFLVELYLSQSDAEAVYLTIKNIARMHRVPVRDIGILPDR